VDGRVAYMRPMTFAQRDPAIVVSGFIKYNSGLISKVLKVAILSSICVFDVGAVDCCSNLSFVQ
jgi:hypothetical protein